MDIRENYNFWCTSPYFDEDTKAELKIFLIMKKKLKRDFIKIWNLEQAVFVVSSERVQTE